MRAAGGGIVEAPAPVDTQQTYHREEYTHADTGAALNLEWIEITYIRPAVTAFEEGQHKDSTLRLENHRITELKGETVIDIPIVSRMS